MNRKTRNDGLVKGRKTLKLIFLKQSVMNNGVYILE